MKAQLLLILIKLNLISFIYLICSVLHLCVDTFLNSFISFEICGFVQIVEKTEMTISTKFYKRILP